MKTCKVIIILIVIVTQFIKFWKKLSYKYKYVSIILEIIQMDH